MGRASPFHELVALVVKRFNFHDADRRSAFICAVNVNG